jgi:hypothetical protein
LFATPGTNASTVTRFREDFAAYGGRPQQLEDVCADMSTGFISGVGEGFPCVPITFDRFHLVKLVKLVNDGVDRTRRAERAAAPELTGRRYAFLRNPETMSDDQLGFSAKHLQRSLTLKTVRAFHLKLVFQELFTQPKRLASAYLRQWCSWVMRSRLPEMSRVAQPTRDHWAGVLRWFTSQVSNGVLEGINSLIQAAKAKAPWVSERREPDHDVLPHRRSITLQCSPLQIARNLFMPRGFDSTDADFDGGIEPSPGENVACRFHDSAPAAAPRSSSSSSRCCCWTWRSSRWPRSAPWRPAASVKPVA